MSTTKTALPVFPFASFLPGLKDFSYDPWTNWQGMFQNWFSPQFVFGGNIQDLPVEQHVIGTVGSYGKQLNCLFDALEVVVSAVDMGKLTDQQRQALDQFQTMARQADIAAAVFQGKPPHTSSSLAHATTGEWIDALKALKNANPAKYAEVSDYIKS